MKTKRPTKTDMVLNHMIDYGFITSWTAIQLYGVTRLSAIIYTLKHNRGIKISSVTETRNDRNGWPCRYSKYFLNPDV